MCANCDHIVLGFDESLDKVAQKGQMDIFIKFLDEKSNRDSIRYYASSFWGPATASDLVNSFEEATKGFDIKKLLQISMDGPNINGKFLQDTNAKFMEEGVDRPLLLDLGSCGLHILRKSHEKKKNQREILHFLRALYYLFCYRPVQRADYIHYSSLTVFSLQFCAMI